MAKQQISKHAKDVSTGDAAGAASRPAHADERQTRRRSPRRRPGIAEVREGASVAAAMPSGAVVDSSAMSTGSDAPARAASQSRARPKHAGAQRAIRC